MKDKQQARRARRRVNAPSSSAGWYGDQARADRDPELDRLIQEEGKGRGNPAGYRQDRPILAVSSAMHNPYLNLFTLGLLVGLGFFLGDAQCCSGLVAGRPDLGYRLGHLSSHSAPDTILA